MNWFSPSSSSCSVLEMAIKLLEISLLCKGTGGWMFPYAGCHHCYGVTWPVSVIYNSCCMADYWSHWEIFLPSPRGFQMAD